MRTDCSLRRVKSTRREGYNGKPMTKITKHNLFVFSACTLIVLQLMVCILATFQVQAKETKTLIVPDNYPSVTDAVGNASVGDNILVKAGTYNENVVINKTLTITGQNAVIMGKGGTPNSYVFSILADKVKISGFTVESMNYSISSPKLFAGGIAIAGNNCTVSGNNIFNVYRGICVGGWGDICGSVSQTTIEGNTVTGAFNDGIRVYGGSGNVVSENTVIACNASAIALDGYSSVISKNILENNRRAIGVGGSFSLIFANNITGSINWGIYLQSSNNAVVANYLANNNWGIYLSPAFPPQNNTFYHNDFVDNSNQVNIGSASSVQFWDNGYPSGGNYWSSYTGIDEKKGVFQDQQGSDGIGDTQFNLTTNNVDRYPLIVPFNVGNKSGLPPLPNPAPIQNNIVGLWHLDTIKPDGSTPDDTGKNPIIFSPIPYMPNVVSGMFDQAINFTFYPYGMAYASPSLDVSGDLTIDSWITVTSFENTTYNNILVLSSATLNPNPTRLYGLAVNGLSPSNATSGPLGAVCGYVYTDTGYNEIVTLTPAVQPDRWTHLIFTRSLTTGMHIYVDGVEQPVMVTYGMQNPTGVIKHGTELYFGADFSGYIDETRISNASYSTSQPLLLQWWFWVGAIAAIMVISIGTYLFFSKRKRA